MTSTVVGLCNLALTRLGHNQISSLSENSKGATLCTLHYPQVRDALLRAHPWNFALKRVELAQDATTPNHEFDYRYALPFDCLKVIRTDWEANGFSSTAIYGFPGLNGYANEAIPYRIEGRYLLVNEATVSIEYIARIEDPAQFDDLFADCLAQRLAAELAPAFTDTVSLAKSMWDIYQQKLAEARLIDAQEGTPREFVDTSAWLIARQ